MSGKGGVGKSYVTAYLGRALARGGKAVGVVDADLNGPTIPALLGISGARLRANGAPAVGADGVRYISMAMVLEDGAPLAFTGPTAESFVWRGAMEAAALREFLGDVEWGTLDFLLLDLPPGMQRYVELCDLLGAPPAVLTVTIPTPESPPPPPGAPAAPPPRPGPARRRRAPGARGRRSRLRAARHRGEYGGRRVEGNGG